MNRRAALSLPPPMADTSALGREQDLQGLSDEPTIHYLDHGSRSRLIRWHYHPAYELHLIVATSGTAIVGEWIGDFEPGHLALRGPQLPQTWISSEMPPEGVAVRDTVIQFLPDTIVEAAQQSTELLGAVDRKRAG